MQSDERFDRLVMGDGAVVPKEKNYNPKHARRFRKKRSKRDVLQAARDALVLSDEFLNMSKRFQEDAAISDDELTQEYFKPYYQNKSAVLESLKADRDWALQRSEDALRVGRRHARESKRLTRKAWWMRG